MPNGFKKGDLNFVAGPTNTSFITIKILRKDGRESETKILIDDITEISKYDWEKLLTVITVKNNDESLSDFKLKTRLLPGEVKDLIKEVRKRNFVESNETYFDKIRTSLLKDSLFGQLTYGQQKEIEREKLHGIFKIAESIENQDDFYDTKFLKQKMQMIKKLCSEINI